MKEHMESGVEHSAKREEAAEKIRETVEMMRVKFGIEAEVEETSESTTIRMTDEHGEVIKEMGFMKLKNIPVGNHTIPVEEMVEACLRYPDLEPEVAVQKIKSEKRAANEGK